MNSRDNVNCCIMIVTIIIEVHMQVYNKSIKSYDKLYGENFGSFFRNVNKT